MTDTEPRYYVVQTEPGDQPTTLDGGGLTTWLKAVATDRAHGGSYTDAARVWLWVDDGTLTPLAVVRTAAGEYDANDYADQTWAVVGPDQTTHATTAVLVDGRA